MYRTHNHNAADKSDREFARSLKKFFDIEAERTISQERLDRVLAPVLARINSGEFDNPSDNEAQVQATSVISAVIIKPETITALRRISAKRKKGKTYTGDSLASHS